MEKNGFVFEHSVFYSFNRANCSYISRFALVALPEVQGRTEDKIYYSVVLSLLVLTGCSPATWNN